MLTMRLDEEMFSVIKEKKDFPGYIPLRVPPHQLIC